MLDVFDWMFSKCWSVALGDFRGLSRSGRRRKFVRMEKQPETTTPNEEKRSINWGIIVWSLMILLLYVLSSGPLNTMQHKKQRIWQTHNRFVWAFYRPLHWAYDYTPLHRPLGIYFHLWSDDFNKYGNKVRYWL